MSELEENLVEHGSHLNAILHYCEQIPKTHDGFTDINVIKLRALAKDLHFKVYKLAHPLYQADAMERLAEITKLTS